MCKTILFSLQLLAILSTLSCTHIRNDTSLKKNFTISCTRTDSTGKPRENLNANWMNKTTVNDRKHITSLTITGCNVEHLADLDDLKSFFELTDLSLADLGLTSFNFHLIEFNMHLRTLNLDENRLRKLEGDAPLIRLRHLSMHNSRMTTLPSSTLHIIKHLISFNFSSDQFDVGHGQGCYTFTHLEEFNGEPCLHMQQGAEPEAAELQAQEADSFSYHSTLILAACGIMILVAIMALCMDCSNDDRDPATLEELQQRQNREEVSTCCILCCDVMCTDNASCIADCAECDD